MHHLRCLGCLFVVITVVSGCFHTGVRPRTADVLSGGDVAGGVNFTVVTMEQGEVEMPASTEKIEGFSGWRGMLHALMYMGIHGINSQGYFRVGLADGAELGLFLGAQEMGAEIRAAVLDEDQGDATSLAASVAAMWRPAMDVDSPWMRLGADISRRYDTVAPLGSIYLSYGPEAHALLVPDRLSEPCRGFGQAGCGEYSPARYFLYTLHEVRLQGSVGMSVLFTDYGHTSDFSKPWSDPDNQAEGGYVDYRTGDRLTFGVVPYVVLWSEQTDYRCVGCTLPEGQFDSDWGVSLTIAYDYYPEEDPVIGETK